MKKDMKKDLSVLLTAFIFLSSQALEAKMIRNDPGWEIFCGERSAQ